MEKECVSNCEEHYNCCDCGVVDQDFDGCGCSYCWSCNACEVCLDEEDSN